MINAHARIAAADKLRTAANIRHLIAARKPAPISRRGFIQAHRDCIRAARIITGMARLSARLAQ